MSEGFRPPVLGRLGCVLGRLNPGLCDGVRFRLPEDDRFDEEGRLIEGDRLVDRLGDDDRLELERLGVDRLGAERLGAERAPPPPPPRDMPPPPRAPPPPPPRGPRAMRGPSDARETASRPSRIRRIDFIVICLGKNSCRNGTAAIPQQVGVSVLAERQPLPRRRPTRRRPVVRWNGAGIDPHGWESHGSSTTRSFRPPGIRWPY